MDKVQQFDLVLQNNLQSYFYDQLQVFNKKFIGPLSTETIHYSSQVMNRFGESEEYFDITEEGRVRDKTLGLKLLESANLSRSLQMRALQDIGDTSLFLCGYFAESLNNKIIDIRYHEDVGRIAYKRLNCFIPVLYEVPEFYNYLSKSFSRVTMVMNLVAQKLHADSEMMVLCIPDGEMT